MSGPRVLDTGIRLEPDPSRVVARLFVPGREEVGPGESRAATVIDRLLATSDEDIHESALSAVAMRTSARSSRRTSIRC